VSAPRGKCLPVHRRSLSNTAQDGVKFEPIGARAADKQKRRLTHAPVFKCRHGPPLFCDLQHLLLNEMVWANSSHSRALSRYSSALLFATGQSPKTETVRRATPYKANPRSR
jgi:hypothetical protein